MVAGFDLAAELRHHRLLAVADAEDGDAEGEDLGGGARAAGLGDAGGAAGEDDGLRAERGEEGGVDLLVGVDLAVDPRLAQAAGDQLGDLAAEVDDEKALVVGVRHRLRIGRLRRGCKRAMGRSIRVPPRPRNFRRPPRNCVKGARFNLGDVMDEHSRGGSRARRLPARCWRCWPGRRPMPGRSTGRRSRRRCRSSRLSRRAWSMPARRPGSRSASCTMMRWSGSRVSGFARWASPSRWTRTRCSRSLRCRSRSRRRWWPRWSAKASLEWGTRVADLEPGLRAARSLSDGRGDGARFLQPSQRSAGQCRQRPRADRLRSRDGDASGCGWCRHRRRSALAMPIRTPAITAGALAAVAARPARTGRPWRRRNCSRRSA